MRAKATPLIGILTTAGLASLLVLDSTHRGAALRHAQRIRSWNSMPIVSITFTDTNLLSAARQRLKPGGER